MTECIVSIVTPKVKVYIMIALRRTEDTARGGCVQGGGAIKIVAKLEESQIQGVANITSPPGC